MATKTRKKRVIEGWKPTHAAEVESGRDLREKIEGIFFWQPQDIGWKRDVPITITEDGVADSTKPSRKSARRLIERLHKFDMPPLDDAYFAISDGETENMAVVEVRIVRNEAGEHAIDLVYTAGMSG